ncbi:MAG: PIN domain-containing protein [Flavobacteriaceae bacterium]
MQKLYLDTNAIIDFLGERHPFYLPMAKLITLADKKKLEVYASAVSISTTYYILSRNENQKSALDKIRKLKVICGISIINDEVVEKALNSGFKDFEDAIQYYSAIETNCDFIITRNEKDFKNALIPVLNADEFLRVFK